MSRTPSKHGRSARRDGVWWAGLVVACAAAAATAHGLYAVASASDVPWPVAVLYPLMTDGLALVAYSATNRLTDAGRRYAWSIVVLAAGLSGAAQAVYLAGGGLNEAGAAVRFGIGAAPALAAAAVAHLLHLIRTVNAPSEVVQASGERVQVDQAAPEAIAARPTAPGPSRGAAERALSAAEQHRQRHGTLPTVTALVGMADVSRGTAGTVLKGLRTTTGSPAADGTELGPDDRPAYATSKIQSHHTPRHHDPKEDQLQNTLASGRR